MSKDRRVLTVVEAGAIFGLKASASYAAARRGDLPIVRVGRRSFVPVAALNKMLKEAQPHKDALVRLNAARASEDEVAA